MNQILKTPSPVRLGGSLHRFILSFMVAISIAFYSPFLYSNQEDTLENILVNATLSDTVYLLIEAGVDLNAKDENGDTVFMKVVRGDIHNDMNAVPVDIHNHNQAGLFGLVFWAVKWLFLSTAGLTVWETRDVIWAKIRGYFDQDDDLKTILDSAEENASRVAGISAKVAGAGANIALEGSRRLLTDPDSARASTDSEQIMEELVEALLKGGSDPAAVNHRGQSALQIAMDGDAPDRVIALLREYSNNSNSN